ncbi:flagellar hook-length control protein FliK, partial [Pseudomonas sp. SIMBA_059]
MKLYPENLGSIRIEIFQKDGVLSARLLASTSQAKELLDSQVHQLKTAFAQQNIQMDRIDIAQSLQETDRNLRDQSLFGNM